MAKPTFKIIKTDISKVVLDSTDEIRKYNLDPSLSGIFINFYFIAYKGSKEEAFLISLKRNDSNEWVVASCEPVFYSGSNALGVFAGNKEARNIINSLIKTAENIATAQLKENAESIESLTAEKDTLFKRLSEIDSSLYRLKK